MEVSRLRLHLLLRSQEEVVNLSKPQGKGKLKDSSNKEFLLRLRCSQQPTLHRCPSRGTPHLLLSETLDQVRQEGNSQCKKNLIKIVPSAGLYDIEAELLPQGFGPSKVILSYRVLCLGEFPLLKISVVPSARRARAATAALRYCESGFLDLLSQRPSGGAISSTCFKIP